MKHNALFSSLFASRIASKVRDVYAPNQLLNNGYVILRSWQLRNLLANCFKVSAGVQQWTLINDLKRRGYVKVLNHKRVKVFLKP